MYTLRLLGAPELTDGSGGTPPWLGPGKPLALLCYLARRGRCRREELAALLWGEVTDERARNAFRQALHRLRGALGPEVVPYDRDAVRLVLGEQLSVDAVRFEAALAAGRAEEAISVYGGDFLDGFDVGEAAFAHWADGERARLRGRFHAALKQAAEGALAEGDWARAREWAARWSQSAPLEADAAMLEAMSLAAGGLRAEAMGVLRAFEARLGAEAGERPPAWLVDLAGRLADAPARASTSGSEAELSRLLAVWRRVRAGAGATALVEGGSWARAALVEEFVARVTSMDPVLVLRGRERGRTAGGPLAYGSVAEALRGALGARGLAGASPNLLAEAARLVPELRDRFRLPEFGAPSDGASAVRLFEGVAAVLDAVAYEQPVCLILDELDRSSPETLDLVAYLADRLRGVPVLVIIGYGRAGGEADPDGRFRETEETWGWRPERIRLVAADGGGRAGWGEARAAAEGAARARSVGSIRLVVARPRVVMSAVVIAAAGLAAASGALHRRQRAVPAARHVLADTLVLVETLAPGRTIAHVATGPLDAEDSLVRSLPRAGAGPAWVDSIEPPWIEPVPSPDGRRVGLHRITDAGADLYVIGVGRRDTVRLTSGGDGVIHGWSPDGERVLVSRGRTLPAGGYDTDLFAFHVASPAAPVPIDTAADRAILDAVWSPDGMSIAWAARTGALRQADVFASYADGSGRVNVSDAVGEDLSPAWSPDSRRIAFTSDRAGNPEIYARELATWRLWRLTWNDAHDARPAFSPDGGFVAFESTRGGEPAVYVMASWGGEPVRVSPPGRQISHAGWRGRMPPYADHLRIRVDQASMPGDSFALEAEAFYADGSPRAPKGLVWRSLDPDVAELEDAGRAPGFGDPAPAGRGSGRRPGLARVVASAGGWRADTIFLKVGTEPVEVLHETFDAGPDPDRWLALGAEPPRVERRRGTARGAALVPGSDGRWESGILSVPGVPIHRDLVVEAWVQLPGATSTTAGSLTLALVAPPPAGTLDPDAPQFLRLASVTWRGDDARLVYAVEREVWTEPVAALPDRSTHRIRIEVQPDGAVAFHVDGESRWRSTIRLSGGVPYSRARLWIGARGVSGGAAIEELKVTVR